MEHSFLLTIDPFKEVTDKIPPIPALLLGSLVVLATVIPKTTEIWKWWTETRLGASAAAMSKLRLERLKLRYEIEAFCAQHKLERIKADDPAFDFPELKLESAVTVGAPPIESRRTADLPWMWLLWLESRIPGFGRGLITITALIASIYFWCNVLVLGAGIIGVVVDFAQKGPERWAGVLGEGIFTIFLLIAYSFMRGLWKQSRRLRAAVAPAGSRDIPTGLEMSETSPLI